MGRGETLRGRRPIGGHSGRSETGRGPSVRSWTGRGKLPEVGDGLGDSQGGPGRVRGPSGRSGKGRGTLLVVWNGSGDHPVSSGRVGGPSPRYGTGRKPSGTSVTGWRTLPEVQDGLKTLGENRDGSGKTPGDL